MKPVVTLQNVWNASVYAENFDPKPRDYLWASELGKSPVDIYLKLKGVPASNPPNMRSLRKFDMGNTHEFIVDTVLQRAGLLVDSQVRVRHQYPGLLAVSGRLDQIFGGKADWERAKHDIKTLNLPEHYLFKAKNIVEKFSEQYPDGFEEIILETKSTSSFMFDVYERKQLASENHRVQLFHYLKGLERPLGHVAYISRDDGRMVVLPTTNPGDVEQIYKGHIETITRYFQANEMPPLEPMIIFDEILLSFKDNWRVKYSNYLTMLYDFKSQMEYENKFKGMVAGFNRVIKRIAEDKNMTAKNLESIEQMKTYYPDFEKHIPDIKRKLAEKAAQDINMQREIQAIEKENTARAAELKQKYGKLIANVSRE